MTVNYYFVLTFRTNLLLGTNFAYMLIRKAITQNVSDYQTYSKRHPIHIETPAHSDRSLVIPVPQLPAFICHPSSYHS